MLTPLGTADALRVTRRGLLLGAGAAAAIGATSCAPSAPPPASTSTPATTTGATSTTSAAAPSPTLNGTKVVVMYDSKDFSPEQIAQIKEIHGIDVEILDFDQTRLNAMMAAGNPPDVVKGSGVAQTPSIALKGLAQPIDQFIAASEIVSEDDLADNENCWRYDVDSLTQGEGSRYGMSLDYSQDFMLWSNKAMYEEAGLAVGTPDKPLSARELLDGAIKMTKASGGRVQQYGLYDIEVTFPYIQWVLATHGKSSIADDAKSLDFTAPEAIELFTWFQEAIQAKVGPFSVTDPNPDGWSDPLFQGKRMANMNYGLWAMGGLTDESRAFATFAPALTWGPERISPCQSATGVWIPAAAKNPYGGFKFMEWFCAGEGAIERTKAGGGLTTLKSNMQYLPADNDFAKAALDVQNAELEYMKFVTMSTPYMDGWALNDVILKNVEGLSRGSQTPEEFAQQLTDAANEALTQAVSQFG